MRFYKKLPFILASALIFASACGDDEVPAPFHPGPRGDAATGDGSTHLPDGGSGERLCTVGEPMLVGEPELTTLEPDRVQIMPNPSRASELLLVAAQEYCPQSEAEGACNGVNPGPTDHKLRRALIFPIPPGLDELPGDPAMVNLGLIYGNVSDTFVQHPQAAVVADRLVVAWLDRPGFGATNVWAQSVDLSDLSPLGTQSQISEIDQDPDNPANSRAARKLVLVSDGLKAHALYEAYRQGERPLLHAAEIDTDGTRITNRLVKEIEASADGHAALALPGGAVVFGRTSPIEGGGCDYLLGPADGPEVKVQQDESTRACGDIAIAEGGTVFSANSRSAIFFRGITTEGQPMGNETLVAKAEPGSIVDRPAIAPFAGGFVVAYVEYREGDGRLRGALLDRSGNVRDSFDLASGMPEVVAWPSIAVTNDGGTIAVAWKHRSFVDVDGGPGVGPTKAPAQQTHLIRLQCE